jgi:hypothetical protein
VRLPYTLQPQARGTLISKHLPGTWRERAEPDSSTSRDRQGWLRTGDGPDFWMCLPSPYHPPASLTT